MADNKIIKKIVLSDGTAADLDVKYWGGLETSAKQDTLISGNNIKTINGQSVVGEGNIDTIEGIQEVTYLKLMNNIARKKLKPGQQYRILDYVTTTTQEYTHSFGHRFDIIVTANSNNTLSEIAKACLHGGKDDYFADCGCDIDSWRIWYCVYNDTSRFGWADMSSKGRGVIYRMIDEWGNDCPYDFKNIYYIKGAFYYTFNYSITKLNVYDASICGNNGNYLDDNRNIPGVYNNVIKPYIINGTQYLNGIYFDNDLIKYDSETYYGYGCYNNIFGYNCYDNVFENKCNSNVFGNNCYSNTFGNNCNSNIFGNECSNNTFGDNCSKNTFGNSCSSNTFGDGCSSNTFGNECGSNNFGYGCSSNIFSYGCSSNTFSNICQSNTFGNQCCENVLPSYYLHNTFDSLCFKNTIINDNETGNIQKYNIKKGVSGKTINVEFINSEIGIDVWVTSSGELIQEPINSHITFGDIDLIWNRHFNSGSYGSGSASAILDDVINSIGIGDYDENSDSSD